MSDSRMRDEDGFLTEHDPEPTFPNNPPEADAPDWMKTCARCGATAGFVRSDYNDHEWVSDCCGWHAALPPGME